MKYIDIHSHLNDPRFEPDLDEVLWRMREAMTRTIVVGTDRIMSERAVALATAHPDMWATIGIHPTDQFDEAYDEDVYKKMAMHDRVVAIGECGIDYFRTEASQSEGKIGSIDDEVRRQETLFLRHIALALLVDKPLMIHGRPRKGSMDAYLDILRILREHAPLNGNTLRGNIHFFVGNTDIAKQFLDLGFTMSFTGVLTFAHDYDEVVRYIPMDMIHAETDAPYVAPVPHRGARNEPAYVSETVHAIARIRNLKVDLVEHALIENAERVFHLHAPNLAK